MDNDELLAELDRLFRSMVDHQREKVLALARTRNPTVTPEDIMNPEQFPELYEDGPFNFEDGILSGMVASQIAVRARIKELILPPLQ